MKKLLLAMAIIGLMFPASALAAPVAQVTGPNTGDCLYGTSHPITGTATGGASWLVQIVNPATSETLFSATGTNEVANGVIARFDTTGLPDVELRTELYVSEGPGGAADADFQTFDPTYDREAPYPPAGGTYAVAGTQALVWWSQTTDRGDCKSGQTGGSSYAIVMDTQTGEGTSTLAPDFHSIRNGTDHEALTLPWLQANRIYEVVSVATDRAGNFVSGMGSRFTTPANYNTVIAGQAKKAAESGYHGVIAGLSVTANGQPGSAQTLSDARGMYRLSVPVFSNGIPYTLTYGPGCDDENGDPLLPPAYCASSIYAGSEQVTLGLDGPGRVFVKSKTL